jgi:hypothetical protein
MSSVGAAPRAAVPISSARAEASRKNGAKSRGPKTPAGKARSAQNALKHGMRAQKYVVLPEEDAAEFAALEATLTLELAPQGVLQSILVGRIARRLAARARRAHRGRAVRGATAFCPRRRPRPRVDPGRQRHPKLRDPAPLSRRRDGGVLARAAHPQGAPGRAGCAAGRACARRRPCLGGARKQARRAGDARPSSAAERTRAPRNAPARPCHARPSRARPHTDPLAIARTGPLENARHGVRRSHGPFEQIPNGWLRFR